MNSRLTLNLGLRYDYNTVWTTGANQGQNFDVATQSLLPPIKRCLYRAEGRFGRRGRALRSIRPGKEKPSSSWLRWSVLQPAALQLCNDDQRTGAFQLQCQSLPGEHHLPSPNPPLPAGTQNANAFPTHPKDQVATNWLFGIQQGIFSRHDPDGELCGQQRSSYASRRRLPAALNANPANVFTRGPPEFKFRERKPNSDDFF